MRGDRAARDTRHNKDHENLKSSLKKGVKTKKHRVVFDESANEFFEADYIIVVRDECGYSDEDENEECSGCGACERFQDPEPGALSPPEGYKDMGLFNRDGTLREQAWWDAGDVVLVGERSGTVFTPQHLQLLRRLQRERLLRSTVCADCDAHPTIHQPHEMDYGYEEEDGSDVDRELRPVARRTGKHIAAGEERPRINSSQQTTPTEECPPDICIEETPTELPTMAPAKSEESEVIENEGQMSSENSPLRQRRAGILKGGRLWKSLDTDKDTCEQNDDQRSTTASDEDGSITPRFVRFVEKSKECEDEVIEKNEAEPIHSSDSEQSSHKELSSSVGHRLETPLILTISAPKANSAVQQLFNSSRPPPPAIEPQLVTSETLRAWDAGGRPKTEEAAVRRVAERNALRCSLLRSEARKKQQPKQETTSLSERIRLLTCDVEDDEQHEDQRSSPAGTSIDKFSNSSDKSSEKSYNSIDKNNEKAFGSASSSSSSSTLSAPVPTRQQPPDLGDVHQEPQKPRSEPRRQFLSTLAPLTACVGSTAHHEGFYYVPPGDRTSASSTTNLDFQEHNDAPAPDVVAGTPGAGESDDSLAAFARASASRTERLRQRYGQESQPVSSDDEHDDYGFHRRPAVRGIAVKQQLGASDEILQQMQNELQPTPTPSTTTPVPSHACQRTNSNYSWPYYSEANLNSRPQSRTSVNSNWSKSEYVSRQCSSTPVSQHTDSCYAHAQNVASYHYQRQHENVYRNCSLYANIGCSDSSQELYSSQTSSEQTSPVRSGRCRRPESPPPIRSHHQLLYVPYSNHYHYQQEYAQTWNANDYNRVHSYYQPQAMSGASTPQPAAAAVPQRAHYTHALQLQTLCPAPARYRPVPAPQPGGGKQMICYSEKVAAPLYQPAPGSPSRTSRGAPEGTATATSPMTSSQNPVYYAMNV
ncbi:uncharacterized protein LOC124543146 [Vanessa cardui]|uniref:uncharacterized protein LOC124543146 n=1 Tax=Vanessa cardui TaxID=171605 RepID=UPI001F14814A|nr:uncharacterized protein LOC124543146 [Vanessa cardui]XP_046977173.1 uncharacterized protein LOC124543146 [Vanessa cardui]